MRKATLPAGEDARRTWRIINRYAPKDADAFAAAVWRYAETGEATPPEKVAPEDWANAQAEVERIVAARTAGKKGGESGKGVPRNEGNRNAAKSIAKSIAESKPTRGREDEDEDEEEDKNDNPKTEDEDAREARPVPSGSSDFGILQPSPSSDFGAWARMQNDPVEVALAAAEESGEMPRRCYGYLLRLFREDKGKEEGARLFVEECAAFVAEVAAGEVVRNKGAALVSRLRKVEESLAAAPVPVEVAPAKVSPPPKVEAAPVQAEPEPPAVEVDNLATPFPMPEPVEETPEPTDAVSLALRACNGGEEAREKVAGLLAVVEHLPAVGEAGFLRWCASYHAEAGDDGTPDGLAVFLRGKIPHEHWAKAEQAARR